MGNSILIKDPSLNKLSLAIVGFFFVNGLILMFREDHLVSKELGATQILFSVLFMFYYFFGNSVKSKYSTKVRVTDNLIELKTSFWSPSVRLNWNDVKTLFYSNYQIEFELQNEKISIDYNTTPECSVQIKRLLRSYAEQRNIQVIGG